MRFLKWYFLENLRFWYKFGTRLLILLYDALGVDAVINHFLASYRQDKTAVGYGIGIVIRSVWLLASAVILAVVALLLVFSFLAYYLTPVLGLILRNVLPVPPFGGLTLWLIFSILFYRYSQSDHIDHDAVEEEVKLRLEGSDDPDDIAAVRGWVLSKQRRKSRWMFWRDTNFRRHRGVNLGWFAGFLPEVKHYSRDLTRDYLEGRLPRVYGRDDEVEKIVEVLNRSIDNNVLLVGDAGVGKRALVYKLIEEEKTGGKRVIELNLAAMMALAGSAGNLEGILDEALREFRSGGVVLFIPEVQALIKAGLSDYLSPTLLRQGFGGQALGSPGGVPVIATTTPAAFKNVIEPQGAFVTAFETRRVLEPSALETLEILVGVASQIEEEKKVIFTYPALQAALELSERYIHDKNLPEKVIELIDAAAVLAPDQGPGRTFLGSNQETFLVNSEIIASVVSEKTGVPVGEISRTETSKLLNLERLLHQRIVGQDAAVAAVAKAMRRARTGVRARGRPIASLLFVGPTGVGKTLTAKTLAEVYFSAPDANIKHRMPARHSFSDGGSDKGSGPAMLRFDMSEFSERGAVIGFIERLADAVRNQPYALVLLDEFEKAEAEIHNLFLQVMEDGRLTDASGRVVDFRSTMIIATSNALSRDLALQQPSGRTFLGNGANLREELEQYFHPELLNRFDGIVLFYPLTQRQMLEVARHELQRLKARLSEKEIELSWSNELVAELARLGYDEEFGARPLRRIIQDRLEDKLATKLLRRELSPGDAYRLTVSDLV